MPRQQTVFSELAVALGMLDHNIKDSESLFKIQNVSNDAIKLYNDEMRQRSTDQIKGRNIYKLYEIGMKIRGWLKDKGVKSIKLSWTAENKVYPMRRAGTDLIELSSGWKISLKDNSHILINGSPQRIFEKLPNAEFEMIRGEDWFIKTAKKELNDYFKACQGVFKTGCNSIVEYYDRTKAGEHRRKFTHHVKDLHDNDNEEVLGCYKVLCEAVSERSSEIFNESMNILKKRKDYLEKLFLIFFELFRVNSVKYILAGLDSNDPFAIVQMSDDIWSERFDFTDVVAEPKPAGQPEVLLRFSFVNKRTGKVYNFELRAEVRWSHGKFCGNPESKLYKEWSYKDLPWVEEIIV